MDGNHIGWMKLQGKRDSKTSETVRLVLVTNWIRGNALSLHPTQTASAVLWVLVRRSQELELPFNEPRDTYHCRREC